MVLVSDAGLEAEVGGARRCLLACEADWRWSDRRRAPVDGDEDGADFMVFVGRLTNW